MDIDDTDIERMFPAARVKAENGHVFLTIGVTTFEMEPEQAAQLAATLMHRAQVAAGQVSP